MTDIRDLTTDELAERGSNLLTAAGEAQAEFARRLTEPTPEPEPELEPWAPPLTFTADDVEKAARALFETEDDAPVELARWEAPQPDVIEPFAWHEYWHRLARAVLATIGEVEA